MSLDSEFIKDERNKIDIQEGIFQMDEEEKNLYKSRLSPYVSIDVIKLNEVQYGYKIPRNSTQRTPLVFDFQSFTESQTGKAILGIESCLLNDHLGFIKSLNGIYESDQTSSLP